MRFCRLAVLFVLSTGLAHADRSFRIDEGSQANAFVQTRKVSAHALVRAGAKPRILVATPAGAAGAGVWFEDLRGGHPGLALKGNARPVERQGKAGVELVVSGPPSLKVRRVVLDSIGGLRAESHGERAEGRARLAEAVSTLERSVTDPAHQRLLRSVLDEAAPVSDPSQPGVFVVERRSVGGHVARIEIEPLPGTRLSGKGTQVTLQGGAQGTRFKVRSFDDRPAPEPLLRVLRSTRGRAGETERKLGFLVTKDALLAGSWQYLSYFGRDTMIAARLLGSRLTRAAQGVAIGSVLDRVSDEGIVAHEEKVGDGAVFANVMRLARRVKEGGPAPSAAELAALEKPVMKYDIDGEFLLAPLVDDFVARAGRKPLAEHLGDEARVDALARVFTRVARLTADPRRPVELRPGTVDGTWRDSDFGLGFGRAPLDVNGYLVPSTLRAMARLLERPGFPRERLLQAVARRDAGAARLLASSGALRSRAGRWERARSRFDVKLDGASARARLAATLGTLGAEERSVLAKAKLWSGVTIEEALAGARAPELDGGVAFHGVALDAEGRPVPVMSSDVAFEMFYGEPTREELLRSVRTIMQPYPVGLMTPIGLLVANPAFSHRAGDARMFDRDQYHGAVVWRWPMTMMQKGLRAQLGRFRGDAEVERTLHRALTQLGKAEASVSRLGASELWSWQIQAGRFVAVPFGASETHHTEANALQLWSTTR